MGKSVVQTFYELVALDAPSQHEQKIAAYTIKKLKGFGFKVEQDAKGNVIGYLKGKGEPFLISAHMDRVPPGKGHVPIRKGDILKSNGETNLGADNAAGMTIILEAIKSVIKQKLPHPPLVAVFTVEEELGLRGASEMDMTKLSHYHVSHGIVYDNAGKVGTVVNKNPAYLTFTVKLTCKAGHPGKDISQATYLLKAIQEINWMLGTSDKGNTRVNIGIITGGVAWNVIPGEITLQGEVRSLDEKLLEKKVNKLKENIQTICSKYNVTFTLDTKKLAYSYSVSEDELLVQKYKQIIENRQGKLRADKIFITSDTNVFRGEKGLKIITISTGTENDHTPEEWIRISDLVTATQDLINLLEHMVKE